MNFLEALKELQARKPVIRSSWKNEEGEVDKYLVLMRGTQYIWAITLKPGLNAGNNLFTEGDYDASDWEVYE